MAIFLGIVVVLVFGLGILFASADKQMEARLNAPERWNTPGFVPARKWIAKRTGTGFAVDSTGDKVCLMAISKPPKVLRISDITEIHVHDSTITTSEVVTRTDRGSQVLGAAVGAAVAGPAGLIVGGLSGKTKTQTEVRTKVTGDFVYLTYREGYGTEGHPMDFGSRSANGDALQEISAVVSDGQKRMGLGGSADFGAGHMEFPALKSPYVAAPPAELLQPGAASLPGPEPAHSVADELGKLLKLKSEGVLSQGEFDAAKSKLLARL